MFTRYTFEDWLAAPEDKSEMLRTIINAYRASDDFTRALMAQQYFISENTEIKNKYIVQLDVQDVETKVIDPITGLETTVQNAVKTQVKVPGTRIASSFLFRFVTQQNQHLLGNGVTLGDENLKKKLGRAFDTALASMGEKALLDGVCWGFWNVDHVEVIRAASDNRSGAVALLSEEDGQPRVLIQFWQLTSDKPLYVRVFEHDGLSLYAESGKAKALKLKQPKKAYKSVVLRDAFGESVLDGSNYSGVLPVVPLYANPERRSEFSEGIKSKIDCFDRIASDFGDNLQMANDIFWVLNNFGGSTKEVLNTLKQIKELRAVVNISDGVGGGTAEPHTFEVPYAARQVALDILRVELYNDYMALDNKTLTGSSLANSAIKAAVMDLNLKCDRFEWQVFDFVQHILALMGINTEEISFSRRTYENETEIIENIYRAAEDLDRETRLKLNPMVPNDSIPQIMANKDAEEATGMASMALLDQRMQEEE